MIQEIFLKYNCSSKMEDYVREYLKSIPNIQKEDTRIFIHTLLQTGIKFVLEELQDLCNRIPYGVKCSIHRVDDFDVV